MFRGLTGEVLRPAVCNFIEKMSLSKMPFHGDDILGKAWLAVYCATAPCKLLHGAM